MKSSKFIWRLFSWTGIVATALLLAGFGYGIYDILNPKAGTWSTAEEAKLPEQSEFAKKSVIQVAALGDSLTRGTGDATGNGYVRQVAKLLEQKLKKPVKLLNNLGINGLRADQLIAKLEERGYRNALREADLILLTIGGNDLFQGAVDGDFTSKQFQAKDLMARADASALHLQAILEKIHETNPQAKIIYVGLYNPLADLKDMREIGNTVVQHWNDLAYKTINKYPNMSLVPTSDLFQSTLQQYIATDHFHPNELGYQEIALRIVQGIQP